MRETESGSLSPTHQRAFFSECSEISLLKINPSTVRDRQPNQYATIPLADVTGVIVSY